MELEKKIEHYIEKSIRPRIRVDGGDIKYEGYKNETVIIGAYAGCATCVCCDDRLPRWLKSKLKKDLGIEVNINIKKHIPYYKKI
ncbi:NifU family protein [Halothermothrix orenii]|uniref:Thioredoxin-like protein n=1 Tax=Halothermothrix orenii (strain H 168 / OCM 544 / DSM 9562) TaxID=373903 RepID=B8CY82_HALOH|nr:NifU family protein [Halothermothrix orenii]ACL70251.1 Thioredoxin-like protein [Halothermothrix orenii H 168]